jgi:hypothetical protein
MSPDKKQKVPKDLVQEMVEKLERESDADWTQEFSASGGKTTPAPTMPPA